MALFSIFGKKPRQPDAPESGTEAPVEPPAVASVATQAEETIVRESGSQRSQRDIARMTAEKIDAIESEIARDILKAPKAKAGDTAEATSDLATADDKTAPDYAPTNLFHTTLIRVDKETMILFKEDMDE